MTLDTTSPETCHASGCPCAAAWACPCNRHSTYRKKVKQELDAGRPDYWCGFVAKESAKAIDGQRAIREARHVDPNTFITTAQLLVDTIEFRKTLPPDIDLVVGISRSGLLPASIIAYDLHAPLLTVSRDVGVTDPGHGTRLECHDKSTPKHVLLIDDTVASGREMTACYPVVRARFPDARITRAVIYARPSAVHAVDAFFAAYDGYHYLEWNFANAGFGSLGAWDFDGLICRDFTPEECADDVTYRAAMETITPLYLPRRLPVPMIVTARPESTRDITLRWLDRHGVRVDRLVMRDFEPDPAKGWTRHIAEYKASHYAQSNCMTFIESDPEQAKIIAEITGRPVLCPAMGRCIPGRPKERPLPSIVTQAVNYAAAMAAHARNGFAITTEDERASRLAICADDCEWYRGSDNRCAKCGCGLAAKVELASSVCPIGRWGAV